MFMSGPQQPKQEKGGSDKQDPTSRAAPAEQAGAEFEPPGKLGMCCASALVKWSAGSLYSHVEGPPKVIRDFLEELVVRESPLVTRSCRGGPFSLHTEVVQADGSGMVRIHLHVLVSLRV